MRNIVYITPFDIFGYGGGAIGSKKFIAPLLSLFEKKELDNLYIITFNKKMGFMPINNQYSNIITYINKKKIDPIVSRLLCRRSAFDIYANKIIKLVSSVNPNIIIFQSSITGYISDRIYKYYKDRSSNLYIIQNFDNFEFKLVREAIKSSLLRKIELFLCYKYEKIALERANTCIFLREEEGNEIFTFYGIKKPYYILPFYYGEPDMNQVDLDINYNRKLRFIFTGSLNFFPNEEAIDFIINNFYKIKYLSEKFNLDINLIIAGGFPSKKLLKKINKIPDIKTFINPSSIQMAELLTEADLFISPVFSGAGMKTKVIEALYYGLPIIASETSLKGYEELRSYYGKYIFKFRDRDSEDFINNIEKALLNYEIKDKIKIKKTIKKIYTNHYNINRFMNVLREIIQNV